MDSGESQSYLNNVFLASKDERLATQDEGNRRQRVDFGAINRILKKLKSQTSVTTYIIVNIDYVKMTV